MKALKSVTTTEDPELAGRFDRVLADTVEALEEAGIHYVFIGGIASGGLGRPRSTHDIDVFVRQEEAELTLRALAKKGFRTERTDPVWLYKAFKDNILVDVIFKSKGEIYLDSEMYNRMITAEFHGRRLRLVAPEDLIIIKAAAHSELCPGHWHDALAILSHANLDWDYLVRRARKAPRRVLSLLLYAQSSDIWVPNQAVHDLFKGLFGEAPRPPQPEPQILRQLSSGRPPQTSARAAGIQQLVSQPPQAQPVTAHHKASSKSWHRPEDYAVAHLREILAKDPRTNELNVNIECGEGKLLLRGEVTSEERRAAVYRIATEAFPSLLVENQLSVSSYSDPTEAEVIK